MSGWDDAEREAYWEDLAEARAQRRRGEDLSQAARDRESDMAADRAERLADSRADR